MSNLADHIFLNEIKGSRLDNYLESGFFRNANMMFRTQLLPIDGELNNVINVRLSLKDYKYPKRLRKSLLKVHQQFTIHVGDVHITPQKEQLFLAHADRFKGFLYKNLRQLLYGEHNLPSVFNTKEISVYDGDRLIAFSFFDFGNTSVASILGVFDKEYARYSLGTCTMLAEIAWCLQHGKEYYYPGYILDKLDLFNYKLRLGDMQYLSAENSWQPLSHLDKEKLPSKVIEQKAKALHVLLKSLQIKHRQYLYPYFSLGHLDQSNMMMFVSQPMHFFIYSKDIKNLRIIIEPQLEKDAYLVALVRRNAFYNNYLKNSFDAKNFHSKKEYAKVLEYLDVYRTQDIQEIPSLIKKLQYHAQNTIG